MKKILPIIYSAHHSSFDFGSFSGRCNLSTEQRIRFSDYGTSDTVPTNGLMTQQAKFSRGLIDLNRDISNKFVFPMRDFAHPSNLIWKRSAGLSDAEKLELAEYHSDYYESILYMLRSQTLNGPVFVVGWDNTAPYSIGNDDNGNEITMPSIVISNFGDEDSSSSTTNLTSCDDKLLDILAEQFISKLKLHNLPYDVRKNVVFKGGNIINHFSTARNGESLLAAGIRSQVQSFQIEYCTSFTHDVETLKPDPFKIQLIKTIGEDAISESIKAYLQC